VQKPLRKQGTKQTSTNTVKRCTKAAFAAINSMMLFKTILMLINFCKETFIFNTKSIFEKKS
jgi:hypothetical protein